MKTLTPKISIITVCLNAAGLLKKTIESVVEQTYQRIEYIIIDGASTDPIVEVVKTYGEAIDIFISEPDTGIYDAMNKGVKVATGDFVIFLNAGDSYLTPDALEKFVSKISIQNADIFYGRILWVDHINNNTVLSDHSFSKHAWDLKLSNFPHPATIYKKKLFTEIGLFDETFKILADYEWNARALVKHNIPFQYIDIAITKFTTDGVSNDPKYADIILQETKKIHRLYFKPAWLFSLVEKNGHKKRHQRIMEKILSSLYCKKLNRVY